MKIEMTYFKQLLLVNLLILSLQLVLIAGVVVVLGGDFTLRHAVLACLAALPPATVFLVGLSYVVLPELAASYDEMKNLLRPVCTHFLFGWALLWAVEGNPVAPGVLLFAIAVLQLGTKKAEVFGNERVSSCNVLHHRLILLPFGIGLIAGIALSIWAQQKKEEVAAG